ncbi:helix-turn-helix domain-containing protein [Deinococcus arenicola]|uniref:helix-turn-helix domain-containing protein n=1 Tax=Deinococcus arenicola TaxID=2994950 RepID=UPI003D667C51
MFYNTQELADIFKVSQSTILRLIRSNDIKAVKLGPRVYRVHEDTIRDIKISGLFQED